MRVLICLNFNSVIMGEVMKKYFVVGFMGLFGLWANSAQSEEWYAGGALLSVELDTGATVVSGASLDEKDTGFKIFVGRKMNENLSIEGFYADYGEASLTGNNGDTFTLGGTTYQFIVNNASLRSESTGIGVSAKYAFAVNDLVDLYVKLGLLRWDTDFTLSATDVGSASSSESGTDPIYGLGIGFNVTKSFSIFADYEMTEIDDDDVTVLGVGAAVSF